MDEQKKDERRFWRWNNPILWGIFATLVVTGLGGWLAFLPACNQGGFGPTDCQSKFSAFVSASPNEVGDTLAGFAGAFAFIWLITTVWIQSLELSEQREELRLTRIETSRTADALTQQTAVLRDEQNRRREESAASLFEEQLLSIRQIASNYGNSLFLENDDLLGQVISAIDNTKDDFVFVGTALHSLGDIYATFLATPPVQQEPLGALLESFLKEIDEALDGAFGTFSELSDAKKQRYKSLRIDKFSAIVSLVLEQQYQAKGQKDKNQ